METPHIMLLKTHKAKNKQVPRPLTAREIEVLQLSADGKCNKEIADLLGISEDTIDTHCRNIVKAMGATNSKNAVALGIRKKIIK
jgi:DNA-binding NarL/FixJ family response regulator